MAVFREKNGHVLILLPLPDTAGYGESELSVIGENSYEV